MAGLFTYVVARDVGFAPNPFFGVCTLATCKPKVRIRAQVGDWVLGTGSAGEKRKGQAVYAMRVGEALSFDEYWQDARFQCKKPDLCSSRRNGFGDNIYHFDVVSGQWCQADSHHSKPGGEINWVNVKRDTQADRVLVSDEFIYWGKDGVLLPRFAGEDVVAKFQGHRSNFPPDVVEAFADWFYSFDERGCIGDPYRWGTSEFARRLINLI